MKLSHFVPLLATVVLLAGGCGQAAKDEHDHAAAGHDHGAAGHDHGAGGHDHGAGGHDHGGSTEAHADHSSKHGGVFFMAPDMYHHLEGTWSEPGVFRVWLYDDHTRPIDAAPFRGRINLESDASVTAQLTLDPGTRTLVGLFEQPPALPVDLELWLQIPGGKSESPDGVLFNFSFKDYSREGVAPAGAANPDHAAGDHSHESPHGGVVREAGGEHQLEFALHGQLLALYLLDAHGHTLDTEGSTASVLIQASGAAPKTLDLMAHGDHFMASEAIDPTTPAVIVATVKVGDSSRIARFTLPLP